MVKRYKINFTFITETPLSATVHSSVRRTKEAATLDLAFADSVTNTTGYDGNTMGLLDYGDYHDLQLFRRKQLGTTQLETEFDSPVIDYVVFRKAIGDSIKHILHSRPTEEEAYNTLLLPYFRSADPGLQNEDAAGLLNAFAKSYWTVSEGFQRGDFSNAEMFDEDVEKIYDEKHHRIYQIIQGTEKRWWNGVYGDISASYEAVPAGSVFHGSFSVPAVIKRMTSTRVGDSTSGGVEPYEIKESELPLLESLMKKVLLLLEKRGLGNLRKDGYGKIKFLSFEPIEVDYVPENYSPDQP